ncbi:MOSC domain protein [Gimesia maris]|uniref:MOSC domain-containing protein n=1 Tax=Gimesia maris TaxID=122 RepID=UPI00118AC5BA|nr:MOSC domain-containing protein [Gimesia maris]QDT78996.1 MOSC domain protein [Gimesia maris]
MITAIFISPEPQADQEQVERIELVASQGIVGDRNFGKANCPGQNLTLIESEEIENYNQTYQQNLPLAGTRRNMITRDVRLNDLVGKEFQIGEVKLKGIELCEPCATLGGLLENEGINKTEVIKAFLGKGGLRADVLTSGCIEVGMHIG